MNIRLLCMAAFAATAVGIAAGPTGAQEPPEAAVSQPAPAAPSTPPVAPQTPASAAAPASSTAPASTAAPTPDAPATAPAPQPGAVPDPVTLTIPSVSADPPPGTVPAIWVEREVSFTYFGRTALYSCDGLRDKVKRIMKQLGALENYTVRVRSCYRMFDSTYPGVERTPRVVIQAVVPQPVTPELLETLAEDQGERELIARVRGEKSVVGNAEAQFAATRKRVQFDDKVWRGSIEAGDCELMEHMRDHVFVPLGFNVVDDQITCTPNQVARGTVKIELEVLAPWTPPPAPGQTDDPAAAP